jgi:hypothetical protein
MEDNKGKPLIDLNKNGKNDLEEPLGQAIGQAGAELVKELAKHPHTRVAKAIKALKGAANKVADFFSRLF